MQKKHVAETGSFNPRIFLAFLLCAAGSWLAVLSFAATPASGTLSEATPVLNYTAGPFFQSNPVPVPVVEANPTCNGTTNPCDSYNLTISVGAAYLSANPNAAAKVTVSWIDTGSGNSDYDLYVYSGTVGNTTDSTPVLTRSASGANPEVATIFPLQDGPYTIKVVPYTATGETIDARIELIADATGGGGGGGGGGPFGGADPTVPGNPRYQNFYAPSGSSAEAGSGEFNIGFNPATGRIMTMNNGPIWRLTPPEIAVPPFRPDPLPECCEALWQDRSSTVTDAGVDPILWTDQPTGRTFASNSTAGANALYAYSDSDGEPSMTQPTGWTPFGVGIVSGADHQTIGSGPFPLSVFNPFPALNLGEYVLYCSQTLVGALCSRSEDLGVSYLTGQVATGPGALNSQGCGGLHGHVHVAPDGTAWLPDKSCGTKQGGGISTDASTLPWSEFTVEKLVPDANGPAFTTSAQANGADPSIAIDSASTVYYCYVNNEASGTEGHARVAVGKRVANSTAVNWIRDFDIGASHGIKNAAHPEAVGGTTGRAACGFIGTDKPGDYQSGTFPGKWYAFIATTYDEGVTWVTVNATPNDPVQSMTGIWQQGGSGENGNRNLLDFNEITVDDKGRVLYGYSDGCVTPACIDGSAGNDKTAYMRVARQSGGKPIFSQFDPNPPEPVLPKAPCLSGTRSPSEVILNWKAPDNGGSDILFYKIYRSNVSGMETFIGQTADSSTNYRDQTPPNDEHLFYKVTAVNGINEGPLSNEVDLVITLPPPPQSACEIPGITLLTDPQGDTSFALGLVPTPAPPGSDLANVQLAQPYQSDGIPRLMFTIHTDPNATGTQAPGWSAYVAMKINGDDPATVGTTETEYYRAVRLSYKPTETFESYTPSPNNSGGVDGRFVQAGSEKPAQAGSNYDGATGTITIIVKVSDLDLSVGTIISGFLSATSQTTNPVGGGVSATTLYDQAPDSLSFAGGYTVLDNNTACGLQSVVSRRTHGSAGVFDIPLPATGTIGIEPRKAPHQVVYTLPAPVTTTGTVTVAPSGSGTASVGANPNQVVVSLSNIPNAAHVVVTLDSVVAGGTTFNGLLGKMDVLLGDTTADGFVNSADIGQTKSRSGQVVGSGNFRSDVNVDGTLNSADIGFVKSKSGTALP